MKRFIAVFCVICILAPVASAGPLGILRPRHRPWCHPYNPSPSPGPNPNYPSPNPAPEPAPNPDDLVPPLPPPPGVTPAPVAPVGPPAPSPVTVEIVNQLSQVLDNKLGPLNARLTIVEKKLDDLSGAVRTRFVPASPGVPLPKP